MRKKVADTKHLFRTIVAVLVIVIIATAVVLAYVFLQSSPTTISISPSSVGKLAVGSTFTVNVTIENAVNVTALQLDLRYDSDVLQATMLTEGPFLKYNSSTIIYQQQLEQQINDTISPAIVRVFFSVTRTTLNYASGSGVLASLTFKVLSDGSSQIKLFPYPGSKANIGTFLVRGPIHIQDSAIEIVPVLQSGSYP